MKNKIRYCFVSMIQKCLTVASGILLIPAVIMISLLMLLLRGIDFLIMKLSRK